MLWEDLASKLEGRVVVVGVGDVAHGDDGVGPMVIELLADAGLDFAINSGSSPELDTWKIRELEPTNVVFVDAVDFGGSPGNVAVLEPAELQESAFDTHKAPLRLTMEYLEKELGVKCFLVAIQPDDVRPGARMCEEVKYAAASVAGTLRQRLLMRAAFLADLWAEFPGVHVDLQEPVKHQFVATVPAESVPAMATHAIKQMGARFVISVATDMREKTGDYRTSYVLAFDERKKFLVLESHVPADDLKIGSITPEVPAANWSEREAQDLLGITPVGHPDPRRLVLPDDFPLDVHPLRREFQYNQQFAFEPQNAPPRKDAPEGTTVIPLGPFYPTLEEPAYFRLFLDGELVVGSDYRGFYNHRAIEKLGDSELNYNQIPFVAQQICGICGQVHSCAYCQAVEDACGIETPMRAQYIRSLLLELERIHSHLLWVGLAGHIIGFETVLMQLWRIREPVMWLMERITGNRKHYSSNLIGGVRFDIDDGAADDIRRVLDKVEEEFKAVVDAVAIDTSLMARLKGVGILTEENARALGTVGPTARGSNVPIDARVDHPYAAYGELGTQIQYQDGCDCWARTIVRLLETFESIRLVRKALADMPAGPVMAKIDQRLPSGKIGLCSVEAARGEAHHYVLTGDENRPYRWRVRAPTYQNLQAVPCMIQGEQLADVPISIGSYDPCFSCTERVEALDIRTGSIRIYTREDLDRMCRGGGSGANV